VGLGFFGVGTSGADWYTAANALPTDGVEVGIANLKHCTDSALYMHNDRGTTTKNIKIHSAIVDVAGKDGIKFNNGATEVEISSAISKKCAMRCFVANNSTKINIGTLICEDSGYDAVGDITGTPAPHTGGTSVGESISTAPNGIEIAGNSTDVQILAAWMKGARDNPVTGAEGAGLRILSAERVNVRARIEDTDNQGARIGDLDGFELDLDIVDAGKANGDHFVLFDDEGVAASFNGRIKVYGRDTAGTPNTNHLVRMNDACDNIDIDAKGSPADFNKSFAVMVKIDASATNIRVRPPLIAEDIASDTTDGSGDITITHGLYSTGTAIANLIDSTANYAKAHTITATNFKVRVFNSSGVAQTSTAVVVHWRYFVTESNGF
jgi:hypothetical protein